jgi:putative sigma-54 modulation protein
MRLLLTGRNVEITPALHQQVARQLDKLERAFPDVAVSAQVVLSRERHRHLTDITLHARGENLLTGAGQATTWPLSVKQATGRVEQQVQRLKGKWAARKRRATTIRVPTVEAVGVGAAEASPEPAPNVPRVVRTRYLVRSMSIDEAAERFVASDDPFVLFRDRVAGKVMMVFRRKDGQLGFIEPHA